MALPLLPPNQSLRVYWENQQLIILSVSEDGVQIGEDTGYPTFDHSDYANGVYVYAEKVSATYVSAPIPRGLTVSTWRLDGIGKKKLTLDASGHRGNSGTPGNRDGRTGNDGSTVGLYIQDLDDDTADGLVLLARGGAGGDSFSSQGKAGDGGQGGRIISVLQPTYLRVLNSVERYLERKEFDVEQRSQWAQKTVKRQDPLFVSARTLVGEGEDLAASANTITKIFGKLCDELKKESSTVEALYCCASTAADTLSRLVDDQRLLVALDSDCFRGGYHGTGGNDVPENGAKGVPFHIHASPMTKVVTAPLPFAHPLQCAMLLERADIYYWVNSPPMRRHAANLYQRLLERLDFLQFVHLSQLEKSYGFYENRKVMPKNSLQRLVDIRGSVTARLRSLKSGTTDFYGYVEGWVPRASYSEYKGALDSALKDFESFEAAYIRYHSVLENQDELKAKVHLVSEQTSQIVARLDEDNDRLLRELQDLDRGITAKKRVVEAAQVALKKAYNAQMSKIRNAFGLSIPQIINAFLGIAMFPSRGVIGLEVGDIAFKGFTSIPTNTGGTVTKEYLVSEFKKSEATIAGISFELEHKLNGTYPLDEAYVKRVVVEKERMTAELDQFSQIAFGGVEDETTRKELEGCFNAYIREVTERNGLIYDYNNRVKRIEDTYEEKTKYVAEDKNLKNMLVNKNDVDLPTIAAHIGTIYQSSRSRVMRLLSVLLRALSFRTLGKHHVLDFTSQSKTNVPDRLPLSLTFTELSNARGNIEALFLQRVGAWKSEPARFPLKFNKKQGKRYHLDEHDRKQLITEHAVTLSIPPAFKGSDAGDFTGCCNVRVYRVRFGFARLKTASGVKDTTVHVTLTHGGNETIVSREEVIEFEHDSVPVKYSFSLRNDGSVSVLDDGNIGLADVNQTATSYAAPGPFAQWTVSLVGTKFDELDFNEVDDAFFDFCGTNYAF